MDINFWLNDPNGLEAGQEQEVTIESFALMGDLNKNGKVESGDCLALAHALAGNCTPTCPTEKDCDVSGDGVVDVVDLVALENLLVPK